MVFRIDTEGEPYFPNPEYGEPGGLLAVGGNLSREWLTLAYANGIFPWYSFRDCKEPHWYCPMERFVILPEEIHVSHSMRNMMNKRKYGVTFNHAFRDVIDNCSRLRIEGDGAWLGPDMIEAYMRLHDAGRAASVEVWEGDELVGGLYGVTSGHVFCGESMFSLRPGASKLALIALARRLDEMQKLKGSRFLIDCQFETPHLRSMGGHHIPYSEYMRILRGLDNIQ